MGRISVQVQFSARLDPWSFQNLLLRRGVLQERLDRDVSRSEAARRTLRRLRFTDEQRRFAEEAALEELRENRPEVYEALTS